MLISWKVFIWDELNLPIHVKHIKFIKKNTILKTKVSVADNCKFTVSSWEKNVIKTVKKMHIQTPKTVLVKSFLTVMCVPINYKSVCEGEGGAWNNSMSKKKKSNLIA